MKNSLNIMILDDDSICNFINTRIAETSGLFKNIQSQFTGKEALNNLNKISNGTVEAPDIILVDLNMPVMNGFDFISKVQQIETLKKEKISIVILTSSDDSGDKENAQSLGIRHYLQKPLTLKNLQSVVFEIRSRE